MIARKEQNWFHRDHVRQADAVYDQYRRESFCSRKGLGTMGHRPFRELTKHFTAEDRARIEADKAKIRKQVEQETAKREGQPPSLDRPCVRSGVAATPVDVPPDAAAGSSSA